MIDVTLPDDTNPSKLTKRPEPPVDDFTSANDRIAAFWRRNPDGRIHTSILTAVSDTGEDRFTVTAEVYKHGDQSTPDATAHATRSTGDPDPITAQFPQETAETAAISRAIRNLGILLKPRKSKP